MALMHQLGVSGELLKGLTVVCVLIVLLHLLQIIDGIREVTYALDENKKELLAKLEKKSDPYYTPQPANGNGKYKGLYYCRSSVLDTAELKFYNILKDNIASDFLILPKVRTIDIFQKEEKHWDKLGYSFTTHVDFLLVDKTTFAPRLGIELDGNSHNNEFVKKRDYFKDELFRSCGIPLIREAVREEYSHLELQQKILKALSGS